MEGEKDREIDERKRENDTCTQKEVEPTNREWEYVWERQRENGYVRERAKEKISDKSEEKGKEGIFESSCIDYCMSNNSCPIFMAYSLNKMDKVKTSWTFCTWVNTTLGHTAATILHCAKPYLQNNKTEAFLTYKYLVSCFWLYRSKGDN